MRRVLLKQAFVSALLLASVVAGCSGDSSTAGQDTPRGVLKKLQGAITEWNKKQYMACFAGPEGYLKVLAGSYDVAEAAAMFQEAIVSAYGQEGWEKFQKRPASGASMGSNLPSQEWADTSEIIIEGDTARFDNPLSSAEARMVCKAGVWRIDAGAFAPDGEASKEKLEKRAEFMKNWVKILHDVTAEVGKPGVKVEDLNKMLGERVIALFLSQPRD